MGVVVIGLIEKEIVEIYDVWLLLEIFVFEWFVKIDIELLVKDFSKIFEMMKVFIKYEDVDEFLF